MPIIDQNIEKIKEQSTSIKKAVQQQTVTYIIAAFGLVAALAWNEAIKALIEHLFPFATGSVSAKIIYALLITLVAVMATGWAVRFSHGKNSNAALPPTDV
ncbi:MAG: hypothetical protein HY006_02025 [Candidatus Sungbacteria bacterium]|nr:hypothetical protein [Candidatus Sungbacteria bacterium]